MPPPLFPSTIEAIEYPAFAMAWLGPTYYDKNTIIAYGGGGGSARTGVSNSITILEMHENEESKLDSKIKLAPTSILKIIDTGEHVCVGIALHHFGPKLHDKKLLAAVGNEIRLYSAISGKLMGTEKVDNMGVNAVALSSDGERCIVGCENGRVLLYSLSKNSNFELISTSDGHLKSDSNKKGVCSIMFSPNNIFFLSSARDGTARVCNSKTGALLTTLQCSITDPNQPVKPQPKGARKAPILVRGCSFGIDEQVIYTCQSGRKGPAYCSVWRLNSPPSAPPNYVEILRKCVSPKPVSSMSITGDRSILALGNVEGSILLYYADNLKLKKKFEEVHDLPVTCISAYPLGMETNTFSVISASADKKLAFLSLKTMPKSKFIFFIWLLFMVLGGGLSKIWYEECKTDFMEYKLDDIKICMHHSILAPATRPGISIVPH